MTTASKSDRYLLSILLFLCLVPVLSGAYRLYSIATIGEADPENLSYLPNPIPIAVHMITYMVFCVIGAFQIAPVFRQRHLKWHRWAGRVLAPIGLVAATTGIWMTLAYPPLISNGTTVGYVRIAFGIGMIVSLAIGVLAIKRRDIAIHQIWMVRSYAIALGASTQALVAIPWFILIGEPQGIPWALAMTVTWLFNLAIGEWYLRRA